MDERKRGREYVDPTPVEWPLGVRVPESLEQKIARMVRTSVSQAAMRDGKESFEEADDFDVGDPEELPSSMHELDDDQELILRDQQAVRRIPAEFRAAYERELHRRDQERRAAAQKGVENATPVGVDPPAEPVQSSPT